MFIWNYVFEKKTKERRRDTLLEYNLGYPGMLVLMEGIMEGKNWVGRLRA